eukprot:8431847-Ditylum_brightwellii.AAC.1
MVTSFPCMTSTDGAGQDSAVDILPSSLFLVPPKQIQAMSMMALDWGFQRLQIRRLPYKLGSLALSLGLIMLTTGRGVSF